MLYKKAPISLSTVYWLVPMSTYDIISIDCDYCCISFNRPYLHYLQTLKTAQSRTHAFRGFIFSDLASREKNSVPTSYP